MTVVVKTEKELAEALKNKEEEIIIEGDLKDKVIRIKVTGKVAWVVAVGAIAVAVVIVISSGGTGAPGAAAFAAPAVSILGPAPTYSAIAISVAAGGVWALNELRRYKIVSKTKDRVVLRRAN